jgi:hypothetical protein
MTSRHIPHEYFVLGNPRTDGPTIGHVGGRPIAAAVVDGQGNRYCFVGVARRDKRGLLHVLDLRQDEWIVAPDLIYAAAA